MKTLPKWANPPTLKTPPSNGKVHRTQGKFGLSELSELLNYVPPDCGYETWWRTLAAVHHATGGSDEGLSLADEWSAGGGSKYQGFADVKQHWDSYDPGKGITRSWLASTARRNGADLSEVARRYRGGSNHDEALVEGFDRLAATDDAWQGKAKRPSWRDHTFTAAQLQTMRFPPVQWVIPDLIPEGLTILAGKPKMGKSWMAFDIAVAVAAGRFCLGDREPEQGDVLYAALEDNKRRLQSRLDRILPTINGEWPDRLTLTNSWNRLNNGGVPHIKEWVESVSNPRLVILDTLAGVKPVNTREGYAADYAALEGLHALANERGFGIVVLHHTRKMDADDPLDTISGTLGLAGSADTSIVIQRSSQGTTLYIRGRDIEEAEHAVQFDATTCRWTILGNASDVRRSTERGQILMALEESGEAMGPNEIAAAAGMKPGNVRYLLGQMVKAGEVIKDGRAQYRHPTC